jgi:DNA-binding MarR family transcriptional regulator
VAVRDDKTRLISLLDELERRALILRATDPHDRRARTITLTPVGAWLHATARRDIHAVEDELLDALGITDRQALQDALNRLDQHPDTPHEPPSP